MGGTTVAVPAGGVRRLRFARFEPTARAAGFCEAALIWGGPPLYFATGVEDVAFAATMRRFASLVAAQRGVGALRRGPDARTAIIMFLLTAGSLTLLLAVLLFAALADGGWWWAPLVLFVPIWLLALRAQLRSHWPRRLPDLAALDHLLPARREKHR